MKITNKIFLFILIALYSCAGLSDELVTGKFYLIEPDYSKENRTLSYSVGEGNYIGVISETVFAVGFNENYIIVKQHPHNNKKIINYFIVSLNVKDKYWIEKGVFGPFSLNQFNKKKTELNISDSVKFTKEHNDYE